MPFVAELAAGLRKVVARGTASETGPSTAEMAKAADASAAAEAADVTPAEATAHMSAATETVSTTEAPTVSATKATTVSATSAAARKRVSGQSPRERGSRCQDDHRLRNIAHAPSDATGVHLLKIRPSVPTARITPTKS
jgi:hypothetical protein